jgi:hypothetical protein
MMRRIALILVVALTLGTMAVPAGAMKYSLLEEQNISPKALEQMLAAGELVLVKEDAKGNVALITSAIVVNAPPEQVLAGIVDFPHYPEFMPSTKEVVVLSDENGVRRVSFHINFKFSVLSQTVKYVLVQHDVPGKGFWWELESGDLAKAIGSWEVIPLPGGRTAAVYSVYSDIRSVSRIIKYFIEKEPAMDVAINASTCILVLKAIRDRVQSGAYAEVTSRRLLEEAGPAGSDAAGAR